MYRYSHSYLALFVTAQLNTLAPSLLAQPRMNPVRASRERPLHAMVRVT
jgi:hypothetical protein